MQCHHIKPQAGGGDDTFENCIPLCLECHGEVEAYNPSHPIGTKYTEGELRRRRDEWYAALKNPNVTVLGAAHVKIDREMVKRLRYICPPTTAKMLFIDRDYETPFERFVLEFLGRLIDFGNRVESHFLDPALESLFAELKARADDMMRNLDGVDVMQNNTDLVRFPKNYPNDLREHPSYLEKWQKIVSRARGSARMLYQAYVDLVHECRLKLEISTIDEL
jgi:hypothetical protein